LQKDGEKEKKSGPLFSFNPDPIASTEGTKTIYKPSRVRVSNFTTAQIRSATRHPARNCLNEKKLKLTSGDFAPFEENTTLMTDSSSPKFFEKRRVSIEYLYRPFGSIPERN